MVYIGYMLWMAPKLDATKNLESSSQVIEVIEITKIESVKIVFPVKNVGLELQSHLKDPTPRCRHKVYLKTVF